MDRETLIEKINECHGLAVQIFGELVKDLTLDPKDRVTYEIGVALNTLKNASDLAKHPKAYLVDVIIADYRETDGEYHAVHSKVRPYTTICGYRPDMQARIIGSKRVPTCPNCLRLLGFTDDD